MRKLLIAVALGALAFAGAPGPGAAAPAHVMTMMSPVSTSAAVPTFSVRCRTGLSPLVAMAVRGKPGSRRAYLAYANNRVGAQGVVTAGGTGYYVVTEPVRNGTRNTLRLQLSGLLPLTGTISPTCGAVSTYSVSTPVTNLTRGIKTAFALTHNSNGSVTRWNPCDGYIHVLVNAAKAKIGAVADVKAALAALSASTGLHFVYDGLTTYVPTTSNSATQPARLVIAWAAPGTAAGQSNYFGAGAIGEGGWRSSATSTDGGATWNWKIVQGFVVIDPNVSVANGFGRGVTRGSLLLHELGHVVGLGHSSDVAQAMYPMLSSTSYGSYGAGDATGLAAVGASHGCTTVS